MTDVDPSTCPACGQRNDCAIADGAGDVAECWCSRLVISPAALDRVPAALRNRACLCRTCAAIADNAADIGSNRAMDKTGVIHCTDPGGRPAVRLESAGGSALIALTGAQVLSWQTAHGDVLWTASHSEYATGKPVRGGIPLVFPWFGDHPHDAQLPAHGFARNLLWRFVSASDAPEVTLEVTDDAATRSMWHHPFRLQLTIGLGEALQLALTIENIDDHPMRCEEALHSYFAVGDVRTCSVRGLEGLACTEQASAPDAARDDHEPVHFRAETDRIYHGVGDDIELSAPDLARTVRLHTHRARSAIVWNPWIAKTARLSQMAADDWQRFCCIESANVREHAVVLGPGEQHTLRLEIRCR